jgi:hypothetical protein
MAIPSFLWIANQEMFLTADMIELHFDIGVVAEIVTDTCGKSLLTVWYQLFVDSGDCILQTR